MLNSDCQRCGILVKVPYSKTLKISQGVRLFHVCKQCFEELSRVEKEEDLPIGDRPHKNYRGWYNTK